MKTDVISTSSLNKIKNATNPKTASSPIQIQNEDEQVMNGLHSTTKPDNVKEKYFSKKFANVGRGPEQYRDAVQLPISVRCKSLYRIIISRGSLQPVIFSIWGRRGILRVWCSDVALRIVRV